RHCRRPPAGAAHGGGSQGAEDDHRGGYPGSPGRDHRRGGRPSPAPGLRGGLASRPRRRPARPAAQARARPDPQGTRQGGGNEFWPPPGGLAMRAMSGRDAMMLAMETPRAYMHTLKVSIVDPAAAPDGWSFDRYRDTMAHRLHLLPLLRWRYLPAPLGLGHPFWAEDPEFDLNNHLRRVACP